MGQLNTILSSAVSIGNLCSMRSPTLAFEKFGTYQSSAMVPCFRTKSLMDSSLFLYGSNCWVHVLILCFLGFAICALCHRSCFARPCCRWAYFYDLFSIFVFQSSITACYRFSVFLSTFRAILVLTLCCLSREFFLLPSWLMSSALLYEVSIADCGVIVYCLLRKSLGCLNWLVYLALPGKVSIADRRAIVYCLLRKSLGCLNRLVYMALLGEVSIG